GGGVVAAVARRAGPPVLGAVGARDAHPMGIGHPGDRDDPHLRGRRRVPRLRARLSAGARARTSGGARRPHASVLGGGRAVPAHRTGARLPRGPRARRWPARRGRLCPGRVGGRVGGGPAYPPAPTLLRVICVRRVVAGIHVAVAGAGFALFAHELFDRADRIVQIARAVVEQPVDETGRVVQILGAGQQIGVIPDPVAALGPDRLG